MKITGFIWLEEVVQKLLWKRSVEINEVHEIFLNKPKFRFVEKGIERVKMFMRRSDRQTREDT
jgi:hypothetical protein